MNKLKEYIEKAKNKTLIISLDLDNTLVNRDLGSNWVLPQTLELLKKNKEHNKIILLVNTGRELIGYSSFCKQVIDIDNAVLGSGSIILIDGKARFNNAGAIEEEMINLFLAAVHQGVLAFVDFSHFNGQGRTLYFNKTLIDKGGLNDLFYSQNPRDWFGNILPETRNIEDKIGFPKQIFRIEFPVSSERKIMFDKLSSKDPGAIKYLAEILGTNSEFSDKYVLKRKEFFNEKYRGKFTFGRLERNAESINKGIGLVNWLSQSGLPISDVAIIHIGDRDSGIIDDTLVKRHISHAFMIMVGEKSRIDNPNVDLYLKGPVDQAVYEALELIYKDIQII